MQNGGFQVCCGKISDALGWIHSLPSTLCERCIAEEWYKQDTLTVPAFVRMVKAVLRGRFSHGDCPYFAGNPIDIMDLFARFAALSTKEEQETLLEAGVRAWVKRPEERGGHPLAVIEAKAQAIAAEFGLEDVLGNLTADG